MFDAAKVNRRCKVTNFESVNKSYPSVEDIFLIKRRKSEDFSATRIEIRRSQSFLLVKM